MRNGRASSAALLAAQIGGIEALVEALLHSGAEPNTPDGAGVTPLMYALAQGNDGVVRKLLACGADVDAMDSLGTNVLKLSLVSPRMSVLDDAIASSIARREEAEAKALELASYTEEERASILKIQSVSRARKAAQRVELMKAGNLTEAQKLADEDEDVDNVDLVGDPRLLATMLGAPASADANVSDDSGNFPLHWLITGAVVPFTLKGASCKLRLLPITDAEAQRDVDVLAALLAAGASTNVANKQGFTPLHALLNAPAKPAATAPGPGGARRRARASRRRCSRTAPTRTCSTRTAACRSTTAARTPRPTRSRSRTRCCARATATGSSRPRTTTSASGRRRPRRHPLARGHDGQGAGTRRAAGGDGEAHVARPAARAQVEGRLQHAPLRERRARARHGRRRGRLGDRRAAAEPDAGDGAGAVAARARPCSRCSRSRAATSTRTCSRPARSRSCPRRVPALRQRRARGRGERRRRAARARRARRAARRRRRRRRPRHRRRRRRRGALLAAALRHLGGRRRGDQVPAQRRLLGAAARQRAAAAPPRREARQLGEAIDALVGAGPKAT